MKPTLYITCGLPYSGKTYLVNKLVEKYGFKKISIDDILFSKGYDWDHFDQIGQEGWKAIFEKAFEDTRSALEQGETVIYDSANQDKASRRRLKELADESGVEFKIIWLNISVQTLKSRWQNNKTNKERFHLPESLFQAAINSYQLPTREEDYIEFKENDSLEAWINNHFSDSEPR